MWAPMRPHRSFCLLVVQSVDLQSDLPVMSVLRYASLFRYGPAVSLRCFKQILDLFSIEKTYI